MANSTLRIATWNLQRPKLNGWKRNPLLEKKLREIDADIWILTETNASIAPSSPREEIAGYVPLASLPASFHSLGESCSTVWSRLGIRHSVTTFEPDTAVCAEVATPLGPMLVYGTIITYPNDPGTGKSKKWVEHRKVIEQHSTDWLKISRDFPNHLMCVAGDFNQNRDDTAWFPAPAENAESVRMLSEALKNVSLKCVTTEDIRGKFKMSRANIDHICLSSKLVEEGKIRTEYWEDRAMSDHNGVCVEIST